MELSQIKQAIIEAREAAFDESFSTHNEYERNRDLYGDECILTRMAEGDYLKAYGKWEGLTLALNIINGKQ